MTGCNGKNISMMLRHQFAFCVLCLCKSILHVSTDSVNRWVRLSLLVYWSLIAKCSPRLVKVRGWGNRMGVAHSTLFVALLCLTTGTICSANCIYFLSEFSNYMLPSTYSLMSVCEYIYVFINASMYISVCAFHVYAFYVDDTVTLSNW
jgi:hypothetical protein